MKTHELAGVIVPIVTPVDETDRVDEASLRKLIRFLVDAGVHGIFAGSSAGEGPLLTRKEWERAARITYEECAGKVHLLGGVMDISTQRVIENIRILAEIGYAHFVVAPTFYLTTKLAEEQLRLFGECRENSKGMEMVAYNIPGCTGSVVAVETVCEMARRGWVRYCKDSSENYHEFRRLVSEGKSVGLRVLGGNELHAAEGLLVGAWGIVPGCANYDPQTFLLAYEAAMKKDIAELMCLQERITALVENILLRPRSEIAGLKYAVASIGIGSGKPVSPLQPLNREEQKQIDDFLQQYSRESAQIV